MELQGVFSAQITPGERPDRLIDDRELNYASTDNTLTPPAILNTLRATIIPCIYNGQNAALRVPM